MTRANGSSQPSSAAARYSPPRPSMVTMAATRLSLSLAVAVLDMRSFAAKESVCRTVRAPW